MRAELCNSFNVSNVLMTKSKSDLDYRSSIDFVVKE